MSRTLVGAADSAAPPTPPAGVADRTAVEERGAVG